MTDSPDPGLRYLSNKVVTADHTFIRMHGRQKGFWYNYLYSDDELQPWAAKVHELAQEIRMVRMYLNNHPGAKAPYNALRFRELLGEQLSSNEKSVLAQLSEYFYPKNDMP